MFELSEKTKLFHRAMQVAVGELYTGVFSVRSCIDDLCQGHDY